jgi:hypothetical protein
MKKLAGPVSTRWSAAGAAAAGETPRNKIKRARTCTISLRVKHMGISFVDVE